MKFSDPTGLEEKTPDYSGVPPQYREILKNKEIEKRESSGAVFAEYDLSTGVMKASYVVKPKKGKAYVTEVKEFNLSNYVRNELNGERKDPDVKTSPLSGKSQWYYPRNFPKGFWKIRKSIPKDGSDPYLGTVFIPTDAHQKVPVYGDSEEPMPKASEELSSTGEQEDYGYGFHYSTSRTTLGCGRMSSQQDAIDFARMIDKALLTEGGEAYVYVH